MLQRHVLNAILQHVWPQVRGLLHVPSSEGLESHDLVMEDSHTRYHNFYFAAHRECVDRSLALMQVRMTYRSSRSKTLQISLGMRTRLGKHCSTIMYGNKKKGLVSSQSMTCRLQRATKAKITSGKLHQQSPCLTTQNCCGIQAPNSPLLQSNTLVFFSLQAQDFFQHKTFSRCRRLRTQEVRGRSAHVPQPYGAAPRPRFPLLPHCDAR